MSVDMNKTIAEASLDNLHDLIVPDAVGFFPPAPGWYIVTLLFVALLFHFVVQRYKEYKRTEYKREALKELETYEKRSKEDVIALLSLAKRVGLVAFERNVIAKLSDDSWWDFMEKHSKVKVDAQLRVGLSKLLYDASYSMNDSLYTQTSEFVTVWIKTHKRDNDV
jgi:hypothetical protein